MKSEETRTPIKHQLDHAAPTVIHDPEQDMNQLERWLRHAMDNPTKFWGYIGGIVVILALISILTSGVSTRVSANSDAWNRLAAAKTDEEREEVARDFPNTPAERSALLQAATDYYMKGFNDLPANKDVALATLKKALDRFQKVADESPADSPQARAAALGVARTLEARNELDKAAAAYDKVAKNEKWKGTPEAAQAAALAEAVRRPEAAAFYKELYAFKPPEATLPSGGTGSIDLPILPGLGASGAAGKAGGSGIVPGAGSIPITVPDPSIVPPPPPTPAKAETKPAEKPEAKTIDLVPSTPKGDAPKPEPTKPKQESGKSAGLPENPFSTPKK